MLTLILGFLFGTFDDDSESIFQGVHPMSPIPALSEAVREELHSELDRDVERGRGALHVACSMGHIRVAQLLAAFGAQLDKGSAPANDNAEEEDHGVDDETPARIAIDGECLRMLCACVCRVVCRCRTSSFYLPVY